MNRRQLLQRASTCALASAGLALGPEAWAQASRMTRILVGFPAGGGTDVFARALAQGLAPELGQPSIVENKPGAGGVLASQQFRQVAPDGPLCMAGFSFGSFVMSHVLTSVWPEQRVQKLVFVGTAASRFAVAPLPPEAHERTLVVHGEADDTVPLSAVMDWARPQILPVTVIPQVGHFFHGQLPLLKSLVVRHLMSPL